MPNIVEYDAKGEITPSDKGIQAAEVAGRRIGAFGEQIAGDIKQIGQRVEQHQTLVDVSNVSRHMSDGAANLDEAWSQAAQNPKNKGNTNLATTFMADKVKPFLDQMESAAITPRGKAYAVEQGDQIYSRLWRQTQGDQAAMTGALVHENAEVVGNNATVSVANSPDQANYDAQVKTIKDTAEKMGSAIPTMPGEADRRLEWKQNYVKTHMHDAVVARYTSMANAATREIGVSGDPSQSPAYALAKQTYASDVSKSDGTGGPDAVTGPEWTALGKKIDDAVEDGLRLHQSGKNTARQAIEDQGRGEWSQIMQQTSDLVRAGKPVTPALIQAGHNWTAKFGAYLPGESHTMDTAFNGSVEDAESRKYQQTDPAASVAYQRGITIPEGQPGHIGETEIYAATYGPHPTLSPQAGEDLIKQTRAINNNPEVRDGLSSLDSWLKANAPRMTKSNVAASGLGADGHIDLATLSAHSVDIVGDHAFGEASREMRARYLADVQSGTSPLTAADNLTNPRSANYFGARFDALLAAKKSGTNIDAWTRTNPYRATPATPAAAEPAKAGEAHSDYLKRIHGGH